MRRSIQTLPRVVDHELNSIKLLVWSKNIDQIFALIFKDENMQSLDITSSVEFSISGTLVLSLSKALSEV